MSNNHPHDNIYSILGKLDALKPTPEEKRFALVKEIRESIEAQGSILTGVDAVQDKLAKQFAEAKKAKPDYIDLDKDGNKKEPMKKAAKEKVKESAVATECTMCESGNCSVHGMSEASGKTWAVFDAKTLAFDTEMNSEKRAARRAASYERDGGAPGAVTYAPMEEYKKMYQDHRVNVVFDQWMNSEYAPYKDDAGNDNAIIQAAKAYLLNTPPSKHLISGKFVDIYAGLLADRYHGISEGAPKITGKTDYTGQDLVKDANKLFTAGGFKLADKQVEPRQDDPKKISTTYFWRKKIPGLGVQELMIEIYNYAPQRTYYAVNDYSKDGAKVTPGLAQKMWIEMQFQIEDMSSQLGLEEGEVKKIPGGVRHTKTDYPGYPTDDTLDNIDNLKGPGGGVRKGRPLKAQTKNPRRDPNAPKKGRGRPATAKSGPVSMPADPFGRTTGKVPKGRKGTVHTVDEAMRLVARSLTEGVNFANLLKEKHQTVDEMLAELSNDMKVFKETGHCSELLRDCMEIKGYHGKMVADEGTEQPQHGGIGNDVVDKPHKMWLATPPMTTMDKVKDLGKNIGAFVRGKPEKPFEEYDPLEEELNELARLAGLSTEGNAFTGKLKDTPKGGKFDLDGKEYTDTSTLDEEPNEGNKFSGSLANAKARHADSFEVDGKTYPVKEAQELVAMLKVAGIDTKQLEEAIEQATQVRGIPVHTPVTPPVTDFSNDNDEEGEVCPNCDGAGCEECYGDEHRDHAHAHAQGMERESAGIDEGLNPKIKQLIDAYRELYPTIAYDDNDEELMEPEEAHDETCRQLGVDPSDMDEYFDLEDEELDETDLANAPNEKYDTIDATMRPGDFYSRNFGGPGDNPMAQPPNVPAKPVRSVKEAILALESELAAEYESIKKVSK